MPSRREFRDLHFVPRTFREDTDWRLEDSLRCLVSIGTGKLCLTAFRDSVLQLRIGRTLVAIATNADVVADDFQKHHSDLFQGGRAFRFNVGQGLENIGLEEASKVSEIEEATRRYIQLEESYVQIQWQ